MKVGCKGSGIMPNFEAFCENFIHMSTMCHEMRGGGWSGIMPLSQNPIRIFVGTCDLQAVMEHLMEGQIALLCDVGTGTGALMATCETCIYVVLLGEHIVYVL